MAVTESEFREALARQLLHQHEKGLDISRADIEEVGAVLLLDSERVQNGERWLLQERILEAPDLTFGGFQRGRLTDQGIEALRRLQIERSWSQVQQLTARELLKADQLPPTPIHSPSNHYIDARNRAMRIADGPNGPWSSRVIKWLHQEQIVEGPYEVGT